MDKVESIARERGVPATSVYFEMAFEAPVMRMLRRLHAIQLFL